MARSEKIKVHGKIRLEHSSGKVWESSNFVVNPGVQQAGEILGGNTTGSIYRIAIGEGGMSGGSRVLPDDTWYLKTGLVSPAYSADITTRTVSHDGQTTSLYFTHVFTGGENISTITMMSEMCLIIGHGSAGTLTGNNATIIPVALPAIENKMFAYRTFEALSLAPGNPTETITVHWTILLENG